MAQWRQLGLMGFLALVGGLPRPTNAQDSSGEGLPQLLPPIVAPEPAPSTSREPDPTPRRSGSPVVTGRFTPERASIPTSTPSESSTTPRLSRSGVSPGRQPTGTGLILPRPAVPGPSHGGPFDPLDLPPLERPRTPTTSISPLDVTSEASRRSASDSRAAELTPLPEPPLRPGLAFPGPEAPSLRLPSVVRPTPGPDSANARGRASGSASASVTLDSVDPNSASPELLSRIEKELEQKIRQVGGNRLKTVKVVVRDGVISIDARTVFFWQRNALRRDIEQLRAEPGFRYHLQVR
ncbi:hypothetical protein Isop_3450 [Isosphaera pallida ATCC 43644]|uniref:Uncharacterized protein n=1 Tax=Isosphaera pallida (strain ATCC 43644 / DSM 9630 / IS1B) TaxID=575540 RepID=E8QWW8_ISOPI|nr:hypothetical protein [Isosphaera pallida]ADV64007.1 hypothetical protein Isop_3450 [Isosphaera pallida ATCC 43644]